MRVGQCQCGAVAYASDGEALGLYVCHCLECRRQSASAFGISLMVPRAGLGLTRGTPRFWTRQADSGKRRDCAFCDDCGSRLWHETPGEAVLALKGGTLDAPPDLATAIHIWTARRMPGVIIPPGATQYPGEPPSQTLPAGD